MPERPASHAHRSIDRIPKRILIVGAMGLVGRRVLLQRLTLGDQITVMTRDRRRTRQLLVALGLTGIDIIEGDPAVPGPWQESVTGHDVVITLAGAGIADRRWSSRYIRTMRDSRVDGTYQLVQAIERSTDRPSLLLSASAVGYYGDRGSVLTDEHAAAGDDTLADMCVHWENQAIRAESMCRVVRMRFGVVLDASGGALGRMLPIFRKGLGGRLGSGRQYMSWVTWHDVVGAIDHFIEHDDAHGAFNVVAPNAVTNREFTETLASLLHRPAIFTVPAPALRLAVGGLASTLLTGQRAWPAKLMESGFEFQFPALDTALGTVLNLQVPPPKLRKQASTALRPMPSPPRLVVVDINELLPDAIKTRTMLQQLAASPAQVVLATSSGLEMSRRFLHRCGQSFPMIIADGAGLLAADGSTLASSRVLPAELVSGMWSVADALDEPLLFTFETTEGDVVQRTTNQDKPMDLPSSILRIRIEGEEAPRVLFEANIREKFWKQRCIALHVAGDGSLEIIHPLADRGIAVQDVARRLGTPRETVMAVVSSERSAGLAEWSGFAVALSDAPATIQDLADVTTEAAAEDGLAEALHTWILAPDPQTTEPA
ncbi:MAG: TIGR01777 family oxidoreductase [Phycisphaerales bacterium]|nr:TIGR01777 family oxidoreductase [Phycisphaerales bacterium]